MCMCIYIYAHIYANVETDRQAGRQAEVFRLFIG